MRSISVAALNTYLTCPRKYYFSQVERLPQDREEQKRRFAVSNIIHSALAAYHAGGGGEWAHLDSALSSHWDASFFLDSSHSSDSYHKARWMLWDSFALISGGNPVRFAYSFEHAYAGTRLRGRVDRIDDTESSLILIEYTLGVHTPVHGDWGLQIYASAVSKIFQRPVSGIKVIQLGEHADAVEIAPDDPSRVEGDVSRLCSAIGADRTYAPKPDRHCLYCAYATICDAAWRDDAKPAQAQARRPNDLFRLFCAVEILVNAGNSIASFRRCAEASVGQLHGEGRVVWLDEHAPGDEIKSILQTGAETEGDIILDRGVIRLAPGTSIIVPIASHGIAIFPAEVTRTAAEILGRSLRLALDRVLNYHAAAVDGLTGLFRRELCTHQLESLRGRARSVIIADIDRFKSINDTYGHDAGDQVIRMVARILREKSGGVAYRLGGEEFVILIPGDNLEYAAAQAESVRASIASAPLTFFDKTIPVTASIGVAVSSGEEEPEETLRRADRALYCAKESGRNRVELAPTTDSAVRSPGKRGRMEPE